MGVLDTARDFLRWLWCRSQDAVIESEEVVMSDPKRGDRVYVPGEADDWPLGNGVITDNDPDFGKGVGFVAVCLDNAAQRHASDGPPQHAWFIRKSALEPPQGPSPMRFVRV